MEGIEGKENKFKGAWNPDEDKQLVKLVELHGAKNLTMISAGIPGRSSKSCRMRWCNHLSPTVQHRPLTPAEDATIMAAHVQYGNKWATIARLLQGRTDNAVKNHWNSMLKRRKQAEQMIASASATEAEAGGNSAVYVEVQDRESDDSEGARRKRVCRREEEKMTSLSLRMPGEEEERSAVDEEVEDDDEEEGNNKGGNKERGLPAAMKEMIAEEVRNYMSRLQSDQTQMMMQRCENLKSESTSNS